jgi:hypothetical protein
MTGATLMTRRIRPGFTIVAAIAIVAALMVGSAIAKSSHFLKVSPSIANPGQKITLSGSVGSGCSKNSTVTIYSKGFAGSTKKKFAGVPSVSTKVGSGGKFSTKLKLSSSASPGTFSVAGRCGGGKFASTKLTVTASY